MQPLDEANRPTLRIGTRGSKLALAQVDIIRPLVAAAGYDLDVHIIRTSGDKGDRDKLGAFVSEIQTALLEGKVDIGLHCLKDLPTTSTPGLHISAYLNRESALDTIILREESWLDLPPGSVVGTGALRRTAQLRAIRPDLTYRPLVGNVDTRLQKLSEGEYDAIVLAEAGLNRLGITSAHHYEKLSLDQMLPAAGQGVLVLETRSEGPDLSALDIREVRFCALAERSFLGRFGTGCRLPIGAYAETDGETISLQVCVAKPDGTNILRVIGHGPLADAIALGNHLAEDLIAHGALDLIGDLT